MLTDWLVDINVYDSPLLILLKKIFDPMTVLKQSILTYSSIHQQQALPNDW